MTFPPSGLPRACIRSRVRRSSGRTIISPIVLEQERPYDHLTIQIAHSYNLGLLKAMRELLAGNQRISESDKQMIREGNPARLFKL